MKLSTMTAVSCILISSLIGTISAQTSASEGTTLVVQMKQPTTSSLQSESYAAARAKRIKEHQARITTLLKQRREAVAKKRAADPLTTMTIVPSDDGTTEAAARRQERQKQHQARIQKIRDATNARARMGAGEK